MFYLLIILETDWLVNLAFGTCQPNEMSRVYYALAKWNSSIRISAILKIRILENMVQTATLNYIY